MSDESAVEVGTDQTNLSVHRSNLEIDFANATSNGFMMKSAYELAMERLQKGSPSVMLTAEQKAQVAEVDSSFNAKIAERKIFLSDQIKKAAASGKFDEVESLEKQLATDVRRLEEDCENKKEKLRASWSTSN
jgi:hypothetical protein